MTKRILIAAFAALLFAAPAAPFWGAFFAGIGKAVGKAIGFAPGSIDPAGLMPVTIREARPVVDAANKRLAELQGLKSLASGTLDHYSGVAGTLRDLVSLDRFRAPAANWLQSRSADRYGTSGLWTRAVNGDMPAGRVVVAYARAAAPVPDWTGALQTLPADLRTAVRREHATIELADAASVRLMSVLGQSRRLAPQRQRAHAALERSVLDSSTAAQSMPALLGKVSVGQMRQIRGSEQTNQLLDALLEAELAGLKRDRDRLARSMEAAASYRALASAQPAPSWRMP